MLKMSDLGAGFYFMMTCRTLWEIPIMAVTIIKYNPLRIENGKKYLPVLTVVNRKIYRISDWNELFKILMYSYCYKSNNVHSVKSDINMHQTRLKTITLISDRVEESSLFTKFSPELYIRVFKHTASNLALLHIVMDYVKRKDFTVFLAKYDEDDDLNRLDDLVSNKSNELQDKYKKGNTKYLIAHINGKVLSKKEKFYRRIEREFDSKVLIGDIPIGEDDELLKDFMHNSIQQFVFENKPIVHEKVFAFGLVRLALKHYSSGRFWPFFKEEYGISIPSNYQGKINDAFRKIMMKYDKAYDNDTSNFIQNICMHSFVCDKCADQFFDYMFDFWRVDLSRSIDNSKSDDGNDIFDILIEEIGYSVQDIMIHTTMALHWNPIGCKNRFRRILRMIDNSYWYGTDYSGSKNRITVLFEKWKNNPNSSFMKEYRRTAEGRKHGRGEKLLSKPTISYEHSTAAFTLILPKQILRNCTDTEHPVWVIRIGKETITIEPTLLQGKAFLFTEQCSVELEPSLLFEAEEIILQSERIIYYRKTIPNEDIRFFNNQNRNIEITDDYISKDIAYLICKKNREVRFINGTFISSDTYGELFDIYHIEPQEGDVLLLPDNHALSIGRPLAEGILGNRKISGVYAVKNGAEYPVSADRESLFFKADKRRFNGTSIKIFNNGQLLKFSRIAEDKFLEFKVDDRVADIYGYIIDLHDYIFKNGLYELELSIPGGTVRRYTACYIQHFRYTFEDAPYIFKDTGTIRFPSYLSLVTDEEWTVDAQGKSLEFNIDEMSRNQSEYVSDRKLNLEYLLDEQTIQLRFELPVLYWKYSVEEEWLTQQPEDTMIRSIPNRIYINGNLNLSSAKMYISDSGDLDASEIYINHDHQTDMYYFRSVDLISLLDREKAVRNLYIEIEGHRKKFFSIVCRSIVRSQTISGDFLNKAIYGYFDILGSSEYSVTIKRKDEVIEEDIPVTDGKFKAECDVSEGTYTVVLYEIEDDDSGFGSVSYELESYELEIIDQSNIEGKDIDIKYVRDRKSRFADLKIRSGYVIKNLKRLDYHRDIKNNLEPYIWNYEPEELKRFTYYRGILGTTSSTKGFIVIGRILMIIDNPLNINEVLINTIDEDECGSLLYDPGQKMLQVSDEQLPKSIKHRLKSLDDDIYKIGIEVRG